MRRRAASRGQRARGRAGGALPVVTALAALPALAHAQAKRETHHAVGEHVEVVDRVAHGLAARVLRKRARAPERSHALELRRAQRGEEPRRAEDLNRFFFAYQQAV